MLVAMRRALISAFVLLFAMRSRIAAQAAGGTGAVYHIDHFTVEDGLAQNKVAAVAQDRSGFMWVGSYRGLQRYDGYSFVRYVALDSSASRELAGPISAIRLDARGDPWVSTLDALFRYDSATGRFLRVDLPSNVLRDAWAPDSTGRVWAVAGNVIYAIEQDSLGARRTTARRILATPGPGAPTVLATSRAGDVWLHVDGSKEGRVVRLNPRTGALTTFVSGIRSPFPTARALLEDGDGRLWLAGDNGVSVLDVPAARFHEIPALAGRSVMALARSGAHGALALSDAGLTEITFDGAGHVPTEGNNKRVLGLGYLPQGFAFDRDGGLWIASLTTGLFRLDVRAPVFHVLSSRSLPPVPLGNDFVTGIAEGNDATLWISTLRGGAYHVNDSGTVL